MALHGTWTPLDYETSQFGPDGGASAVVDTVTDGIRGLGYPVEALTLQYIVEPEPVSEGERAHLDLELWASYDITGLNMDI